MTAPVPPGRVQAPPLTAAEAEIVARFDAAPDLDLAAETRQETVARAMWDADPDMGLDLTESISNVADVYRRLAAAAIAADDAWRAEQEGELRERVEAAVAELDRSFPEDVYATHRFVRSIRAALAAADAAVTPPKAAPKPAVDTGQGEDPSEPASDLECGPDTPSPVAAVGAGPGEKLREAIAETLWSCAVGGDAAYGRAAWAVASPASRRVTLRDADALLAGPLAPLLAAQAADTCRTCRSDFADDCGHHSWAGLMDLLDEHWPDDIFPTRYEDDDARDAGARIVSLLRWVRDLTEERDAAQAAVDRVEALAAEWAECSPDVEIHADVVAAELRRALDPS
jgi:hypothetical protein